MACTMVVVVTEMIEVQQAFASALGPCGLAPIIASTVEDALEIMSSHTISLIFCSDELQGAAPDILIQHRDLQTGERVPVVVVSRHDNWERHLYFLYVGAFDYVLYPLSQTEIDRITRNVMDNPMQPIIQRKRRIPHRQLAS